MHQARFRGNIQKRSWGRPDVRKLEVYIYDHACAMFFTNRLFFKANLARDYITQFMTCSCNNGVHLQ